MPSAHPGTVGIVTAGALVHQGARPAQGLLDLIRLPLAEFGLELCSPLART
jgi:hypothetical protein